MSLPLIGQSSAAPAANETIAAAPDTATGAADPAQAPSTASNDAASAIPAAAPNGRVFGVLPNYRTADGSLPFAPITAKRKMYIASKDSFDYPIYYLSAVFASIYQLQNSNPSFGQGMEGYGKRLGASLADQTMGNFFTEGLFPTLLHADPRYFRKGDGPKWHRLGYAVTRVLINRNDKGNWTFNYSEWLGNASAVAISNTYYPDTRNASDNIQKLTVQVGTDAFSNVLKEFWPDIKRHYFTKKSN